MYSHMARGKCAFVHLIDPINRPETCAGSQTTPHRAASSDTAMLEGDSSEVDHWAHIQLVITRHSVHKVIGDSARALGPQPTIGELTCGPSERMREELPRSDAPAVTSSSPAGPHPHPWLASAGARARA